MKSLEEFFFCPFLKPLYLRNKHIDVSIFLHISKVWYVKLIQILFSRKGNYNKMVEPASLSNWECNIFWVLYSVMMCGVEKCFIVLITCWLWFWKICSQSNLFFFSVLQVTFTVLPRQLCPCKIISKMKSVSYMWIFNFLCSPRRPRPLTYLLDDGYHILRTWFH